MLTRVGWPCGPASGTHATRMRRCWLPSNPLWPWTLSLPFYHDPSLHIFVSPSPSSLAAGQQAFKFLPKHPEHIQRCCNTMMLTSPLAVVGIHVVALALLDGANALPWTRIGHFGRRLQEHRRDVTAAKTDVSAWLEPAGTWHQCLHLVTLRCTYSCAVEQLSAVVLPTYAEHQTQMIKRGADSPLFVGIPDYLREHVLEHAAHDARPQGHTASFHTPLQQHQQPFGHAVHPSTEPSGAVAPPDSPQSFSSFAALWSGDARTPHSPEKHGSPTSTDSGPLLIDNHSHARQALLEGMTSHPLASPRYDGPTLHDKHALGDVAYHGNHGGNWLDYYGQSGHGLTAAAADTSHFVHHVSGHPATLHLDIHDLPQTVSRTQSPTHSHATSLAPTSGRSTSQNDLLGQASDDDDMPLLFDNRSHLRAALMEDMLVAHPARSSETHSTPRLLAQMGPTSTNHHASVAHAANTPSPEAQTIADLHNGENLPEVSAQRTDKQHTPSTPSAPEAASPDQPGAALQGQEVQATARPPTPSSAKRHSPERLEEVPLRIKSRLSFKKKPQPHGMITKQPGTPSDAKAPYRLEEDLKPPFRDVSDHLPARVQPGQKGHDVSHEPVEISWSGLRVPKDLTATRQALEYHRKHFKPDMAKFTVSGRKTSSCWCRCRSELFATCLR